MSSYNELHYNVDTWYDSLNDVHQHAWDEHNKAVVYPRFNQYFYCYLSCIEEFSADYE